MKIYIIEDESLIRDELVKLLCVYGYNCEAFDGSFEDVVKETLAASPDLVLLDINLPYWDGYYVCRELRKKSSVPIIIVTSRSTNMDELMGLNLGADDFITKPYNKQILLARIEAILKRSNKQMAANDLAYKGVQVHLSKSRMEYQGQIADLTKNEIRILTFLIMNPDRIVSRDELMDELWQTDEFVDDNTLTVNVNRLRRKLEDIGAAGFISTKRGQGYIV